MKKSTDIAQRIQDFLDEVESNELMDRVYDNDFENYYELTSTLEEARDCAKNGDYKQAMDWMYEFVKTLDTMTADWEGIEDLETYEFDGIVRDLRDMSKSTKKMKKAVSWVEPTQEYKEAFERFVPITGRADTEQGEILRCGSRVIYRFYNDGDKYNIGYGRETVNPALNYLIRCSDSKISGIASEIVKYINDVLVSNGIEPSGGFSRDMFYFDDEADEILDAISEDEYDRLLHKLGDALNEYASRLMNEEAEDRSYYASTKKMKKSRVVKNIDDAWDAVSSSEDAKFIQEVVDNGNLIEEYDADEDGSKVHVKIYSYDYERYRVVYVDDYPPFMQYDEANVFWKDRKHGSAKKMKKDYDIDGVFDDSYQKPHGKYVLHLNLNGDSFYPKYFDDEESFNREVQRAIDNGYTESEWSNYSDNEGLHRRFARDDWGKSAKKSYTPDYQDFRSMVGSIRNTGNHNKVFKE